jgi:hypothetical protein
VYSRVKYNWAFVFTSVRFVWNARFTDEKFKGKECVVDIGMYGVILRGPFVKFVDSPYYSE